MYDKAGDVVLLKSLRNWEEKNMNPKRIKEIKGS